MIHRKTIRWLERDCFAKFCFVLFYFNTEVEVVGEAKHMHEFPSLRIFEEETWNMVVCLVPMAEG